MKMTPSIRPAAVNNALCEGRSDNPAAIRLLAPQLDRQTHATPRHRAAVWRHPARAEAVSGRRGFAKGPTPKAEVTLRLAYVWFAFRNRTSRSGGRLRIVPHQTSDNCGQASGRTLRRHEGWPRSGDQFGHRCWVAIELRQGRVEAPTTRPASYATISTCELGFAISSASITARSSALIVTGAAFSVWSATSRISASTTRTWAGNAVLTVVISEHLLFSKETVCSCLVKVFG